MLLGIMMSNESRVFLFQIGSSRADRFRNPRTAIATANLQMLASSM